MADLSVSYSNPDYKCKAETLAAELGLPVVALLNNLNSKTQKKDIVDAHHPYMLHINANGLTLKPIANTGSGEVRCEFVSGSNRHRINYGGGNGQSIAKAVGVSGKFQPQVLDVTAGLGRDAFVLAGLGCNLTLLERNPIVYKLLEDGLLRAQLQADSDLELGTIISRMQLLNIDCLQYLDALKNNSIDNTIDNNTTNNSQPDIIYIDPMFPLRKKSAKVKKDMQALHKIVGADEDSGQILDKALANARYRVVVKRAAHAEFLADTKPTYSLNGKSTRYDIFALQKLPG